MSINKMYFNALFFINILSISLSSTKSFDNLVGYKDFTYCGYSKKYVHLSFDDGCGNSCGMCGSECVSGICQVPQLPDISKMNLCRPNKEGKLILNPIKDGLIYLSYSITAQWVFIRFKKTKMILP
jgi:hypothetical protein